MDLLVSNFYEGRDNKLKRVLHINEEPIDETTQLAITDIHLVSGNVCLKLSDGELEFDDGTVIAKVGNYFNKGNHRVRVTVFTEDDTNGIAWDTFNLNILPWEECEV